MLVPKNPAIVSPKYETTSPTASDAAVQPSSIADNIGPTVESYCATTPEQKESKADSALLHVFKKNSINVARTSSHDFVESKTPAK